MVWLDDKARYDRDEPYRQRLHFFSDNNALVRRSVWEQIPYPDVDFAEDQIWAQQIIEAGWKRAMRMMARSTIRTISPCSKNCSAVSTNRMRCIVCSAMSCHQAPSTCCAPAGVDTQRSRLCACRRLSSQPFRYCGQDAAPQPDASNRALLGSRAQRLPECVRNWLSGPAHDAWIANIRLANKKNATMKHCTRREQRGAMAALTVSRRCASASGKSSTAALMGSPVFAKAEIVRAYGFVVEHPRGTVSPRHGVSQHRELVHSQVGRGSGGHLNIFRFIRNLEHQGFDCRIIISGGPPTLDPREVEREIADWFSPESQGLYRFRQRADRPHFDRYRVAHRIRCPQLSNDAA